MGLTVFTLSLIITPIFQGLGFFFVALERHFLWSRTVLSVPFSLSRVEGALLGPLEGYLTDKLGSRRMILIGFSILGGGFALFGAVQNVLMYYVAFLVIFLGAGLGGFIPLIAAINSWFVKHRSKAMGIGLLGINLGALLAPLLGTAIETFGWRSVAFALAIITWMLAAPIAFLVKNTPEEYGLHPDGNEPIHPIITSGQEQSATESTRPDLSEEVNLSVGQALRTSSFWAIALTHGFSATAAMTVTVHLAPALTDDNMSLPMVGFVVMTFGVTGALFQLIGGFLGDHFSKPRLISVFVILQSTGILILATLHTPSMAFLFAVLYGAGLGGRIPLLTAIRGDYFGRANFATILGVSQVPMNLIMMGAPVAAGYLFDTLGSYTIPFLGLAVLNYIGAIFILGARKPASPTPKRTQLP